MSYKKHRHYYKAYTYRRNFFQSGWAGGVILLIFTIIALILANNQATKDIYHHILEAPVGFSFGEYSLMFPLEIWINDALMAIFFFVVGLEIKREIMAGELKDMKQASLPISAAIGGMVVPALIFAAFNVGTDYIDGWGVPMATDIAFAIGIMSLLGKRVPLSLKVFLTALAIVDDLGAILVIAFFYTSSLNFYMLGTSLILFLMVIYMNHRGVYKMNYFIIPSILLWICLFYSGIHATLAGVMIAMALPTRPRFKKQYFARKVNIAVNGFNNADIQGVEVLSNEVQYKYLHHICDISKNSTSLSQRLEHSLAPIVTFVIMPLFALANAGVTIGSISDLTFWSTTFGSGIVLGLVVGKPVGIFLASWIAIKLNIARLPDHSTWTKLLGVACLGGIGFTMSIFINNLAFDSSTIINEGKMAILIASVVAALLGIMAIMTDNKRDKTKKMSRE